jgi:ABC-type branched-subunit amino acid transport system substrate-binding protein
MTIDTQDVAKAVNRFKKVLDINGNLVDKAMITAYDSVLAYLKIYEESEGTAIAKEQGEPK